MLRKLSRFSRYVHGSVRDFYPASAYRLLERQTVHCFQPRPRPEREVDKGKLRISTTLVLADVLVHKGLRWKHEGAATLGPRSREIVAQFLHYHSNPTFSLRKLTLYDTSPGPRGTWGIKYFSLSLIQRSLWNTYDSLCPHACRIFLKIRWVYKCAGGKILSFLLSRGVKLGFRVGPRTQSGIYKSLVCLWFKTLPVSFLPTSRLLIKMLINISL